MIGTLSPCLLADPQTLTLAHSRAKNANAQEVRRDALPTYLATLWLKYAYAYLVPFVVSCWWGDNPSIPTDY